MATTSQRKLDRHEEYGKLLPGNLEAVAERLRTTLAGRKFSVVRISEPTPEYPEVEPNVRLVEPVAVEREGEMISFSTPHYLYMFTVNDTGPDGQLPKYKFVGSSVATITNYSPSGHRHVHMFIANE